MPTTTGTARPNAEIYAKQFAARLSAGGWDVSTEPTSSPKTRDTPGRVRWGVLARRGTDSISFSWTTVTDGGPRTTKYLGGKLSRPLAARERDREVSLRTIGTLNGWVGQLT